MGDLDYENEVQQVWRLTTTCCDVAVEKGYLDKELKSKMFIGMLALAQACYHLGKGDYEEYMQHVKKEVRDFMN